MEIRNIAIIAHVDHGKTTLVDAMLKQTGVFAAHQETGEQILDTNALERERGITILAKNTAVFYRDVKINIVDTPGHADFGGEVERVMGMVDGALLLVDAAEGPMPQTRYVLRKALARGLRPVVVINKLDRSDGRPQAVVDEVLDLFIELGATDAQAYFPVIWAVARDGVAADELEEIRQWLAFPKEDRAPANILPLLDAILKEVPPPDADHDGPLQLLVTNLGYDDYVGRLAIGRIQRGRLEPGMPVAICRSDEDRVRHGRVEQLYTFAQLERQAVEEAPAGDIVAIAGIEEIAIGDTVVSPDQPEPLPALTVDEPTLTVIFRVNDGPLAGRDGEYVTSRRLRERLLREAHTNVALKVNETDSPDAFEVCGRGELHLGILIETMRREGYEFTVSRPQPVLRQVDGVMQEPFEEVVVEVPEDFLGTVMERFGARKGELQKLDYGEKGTVRLEFLMPARALVGFHSRFLSETKGYGVLYHSFHGYDEHQGDLPSRANGSLVAWEAGVATTYALLDAQKRGQLFIEPGTEVYEGMIVGENARPEDLDINVSRTKHVTNIRSAHAEIAERLNEPRLLSLEQALAYIADDELIEVTPIHVRLRKRVLDRNDRHRIRKRARKDGAVPGRLNTD